MANYIFLIFLIFSLLSAEVSQAAESKHPPHNPPAYATWKDTISGLEFSWLPGGCFNLGSQNRSKAKFLHEKPVHEVCVDGFWMAIYEVTNAQYRQYKPDHDSGEIKEGSFDKKKSLDRDRQPVVYVSWYEAKEYANWLNKRAAGLYHFRLPTEAEWEFSCRAGTDTIRYWGEDSSDACQYANVADFLDRFKRVNFHDCSDGVVPSAPVGTFTANAAGLYDMLGNVWEWCEDNYGKEAYKRHNRENPVYRQVEDGFDYRVIRGGSWLSEPDAVRCAKRSPAYPESKFNVLGFRLVVEIARDVKNIDKK